jgi:hypothetical protein
MSNLWYDLAGYKLCPDFATDEGEEPLRDTLPMAPGNERHYQRATLRRYSGTLTYDGADEATFATWLAAARAAETGTTLVTPAGHTYTVVTVSFRYPPTSTTVASGSGTTSATGTVERNLSLELKSL